MSSSKRYILAKIFNDQSHALIREGQILLPKKEEIIVGYHYTCSMLSKETLKRILEQHTPDSKEFQECLKHCVVLYIADSAQDVEKYVSETTKEVMEAVDKKQVLNSHCLDCIVENLMRERDASDNESLHSECFDSDETMIEEDTQASASSSLMVETGHDSEDIWQDEIHQDELLSDSTTF